MRVGQRGCSLMMHAHTQAFRRLGVQPPIGVMLYGVPGMLGLAVRHGVRHGSPVSVVVLCSVVWLIVPGTGKTLLAKAVASDCAANFLAVSVTDIVRGFVGESEKALAKAFRTAQQCRYVAARVLRAHGLPCEPFAHCLLCQPVCHVLRRVPGDVQFARRWGTCTHPHRRPPANSLAANDTLCLCQGLKRLTSQLLLELDALVARQARVATSSSQGVGADTLLAASRVVVLAATNVPEAVDTAFLRSGRAFRACCGSCY